MQDTNTAINGVTHLEQAHQLLKLLDIGIVINLVIPHQTIIDRISNRWIHVPSGRTYAYDYNPPKTTGLDDITGEPLSQRDDDKPEAVGTRLQTYENQTKPVLDVFKTKGIIIHDFYGTESNKIYPEVKKNLNSFFETKW